MALEGAAKGQAEVNRYQYEQREVESAARLRTTVSAESSDHKFARFLASGGDSFEGRSIGIDANGYGVESKFYTAVWKVVRDRSALIPKGVVVKFTARILQGITRCSYGPEGLNPDDITVHVPATLIAMPDMLEKEPLGEKSPLKKSLDDGMGGYYNACKGLAQVMRSAHGDPPADHWLRFVDVAGGGPAH